METTMERTGEEMLTQSFVYLVSPRGGNNFAARVLNGCDKVATHEIERMGVAPTANGRFALYYNPSWVAKLSPRMLKLVLMHEAAHIFLRHHERFLRVMSSTGSNERRQAIRAFFNLAADLAVNETIVRNEKEFPDAVAAGEWNGLMAETFGVARGLAMEDYLALLAAVPEEARECLTGVGGESESASQPSDKGSSSRGGKSTANNGDRDLGETPEALERVAQEQPSLVDEIAEEFDRRTGGSHRGWQRQVERLTDDEVSNLANRLRVHMKQLVKTAFEQTERAKGSIPGGLRSLVEAILAEDQVPWDAIFADCVEAQIRTKLTSSMGAPNAALMALDDVEPWPGHGLDPEFCVIWITDTSGSVADAEFARAIGVMNALLATDHRIRCRHIMVDAVIQKEVEVNNIEAPPQSKDHERAGYGGTRYGPAFRRILGETDVADFAPGAERCEEPPRSPDLVIVFTDGEVTLEGDCIPDYHPSCPIVWLVAPSHQGSLPPGMDDAAPDRVIEMKSQERR
jgi:predicted metal-dependent peptidase